MATKPTEGKAELPNRKDEKLVSMAKKSVGGKMKKAKGLSGAEGFRALQRGIDKYHGK